MSSMHDQEARVMRTNAALRGIGLIVLVLAFLGVSRSFTSSNDPTTPPAQKVTVYAASSLRDVLPKLDPKAKFSFGGSGDLRLQIERGAPADLFLSASPKEAQALADTDRCTTPVTFATNTLALIVPAGNPARITGPQDLATGPKKRLAVGAEGVPVGDSTRKLLAALRLESVLTRNTVSQEDKVAGVVTKVALGSADAGFVYVTDVKLAGDRVTQVPLPEDAQPTIEYASCLVNRRGTNRDGAAALAERLTSLSGRDQLLQAGFGLPPR